MQESIMNFLNKLERSFLGRLAIPNLMRVIIGAYVIGYIISFTNSGLLNYLTLEPYYIMHGQVWRLITWILIPPNRRLIWAIIMMIFYYQLGNALEHTWGTFRFNAYIWGGIIFTIAGAFLLYGIFASQGQVVSMGSIFSTYYINMSIFLAFAVCYPNMEVMLYFIIPIKMKWMSIFYIALVVYNMVNENWAVRVAILMSLLNFLIFFLLTRNYKKISPSQMHRRNSYKRQTKQPKNQVKIAKHRCAICGRTEADGANLEFRFCSKCNGNFEYCQDHLFTHQHIQ